MRSLRPVVPLGLIALASGLAPAQAPEPTFVAGDLGTLSAKVVDRDDVDERVTLLTVEVQNRAGVDAEPLTFALSWQDRGSRQPQVQTLERARLPHVARYGRPTPANGKQRYRLRAGGLPRRARMSVEVTAATFHRDGAVPAPDLRIGAITQVQRTSLIGTFPVSQVRLHNPFARAIEVLLAVRLVQPVDCNEVFGVRLEAGRVLDWTITSRPGGGPVFLDPETPPACAMKATKVELIDWCLVGTPDAEAGAQLLREPYERWYRWPAGSTVTGTFTYRGRRKQANAQPGEPPVYDEFAATGRFSLGRTGSARVELQNGTDDGVASLLQRAFADLLRPDFPQLAGENRLVLVAADRVALVGPGWDPDRSRARNLSTASSEERPELASYLTVSGGRVTGDELGRWHTRAFGDRHVVSRREGSSVVATWSWGEQRGRLVPNAFASTTTFGDEVYESGEVTMTDLEFGGVPLPPPPAPAGEGAEALRAIWQAGFRLTDVPLAIEAAFEITTAGTDLVWHGETKLRGTVTMRGIGPHQQHAAFTFRPAFAAEKEIALAAAIRDRWLIWYPRDFNARPQFAEFFRGATIEAPDAAGDFTVRDHRITKVRTKQGVIEGYEQGSGLRTTFKRAKVGEQMVVTCITELFGDANSKSSERWTATTTIGWQQIDEHVLPVSWTFERIFDKDWGPEKIVLRNVRLRG